MTHQEKLRLAVEARVALNTARKWIKGGKVTDANAYSLERAAKKLGLEVERQIEKPKR